MGTNGEKSASAIGFLTVVEHEQHGLFGGYLILNLAGRPLEFHCTAPVKPNRAQQILYGPTLQPYLYGEQIGQTLVNKGTLQPLVVCTDLAAVMSLREYVDMPLAFVTDSQQAGGSTTGHDAAAMRLDGAHGRAPAAPTLKLGRSLLAVMPLYDGDRARISERLTEVAESFDFAEPFGRIREAIDEAQRANK